MKLRSCRTRSTDYTKTHKTMLTPKSSINRALILIKYGDTRLLEIFVGVFSLVWGLYLVFPVNSFTTTTVFLYFSQFVPEWAIGIGLMLVGISTTLYATSDSCEKRRTSLFISHLTWAFIFAFAIASGRTSPAICTYGFFSITLMYLFIKSPSCR